MTLRFVWIASLAVACSPKTPPPPPEPPVSSPAASTGEAPSVSIVEIVAASEATCARTSDRRVVCWGAGMRRRPKDAPITSSTRMGFPALQPVAMTDLPPAVQLAAGDRHFCARTESGAVYCWGSNKDGQLARDSRTSPFGPQRIEGIARATHLIAGANTSCVVEKDVGVRCWGSRAPLYAVPEATKAKALVVQGDELCGVMLDHRVVCWSRDRYAREAAVTSRTAVESAAVLGRFTSSVASDLCFATREGTVLCSDDMLFHEPTYEGVTQLAGGDNYLCVVTKDGAVRCLGDSLWGGAGAHDLSDAPPTPLPLPPVREIAVGEGHTCALTRDGRILCWGANHHGQLGDGGSGFTHQPLRVAGDALEVSAGREQTCIRTQNGVSCTHQDLGFCSEPQWLPAAGSESVTRLATGGGSCVLVGNALHCQSRGAYEPMPNVAPVAELTRQAHGLCLLHQNGTVTCRGSGVTFEPVSVPKMARFANTPAYKGFCGLTVGGDALCYEDGSTQSFAQLAPAKHLTTGGDVCVIERNDRVICAHRDGQPKKLSWISKARDIASIGSYTCAITTDGKLACRGVLPRPHRYPPPSATDDLDVTFPSPAVSLAPGERHMCVHLRDGSVHCWGANDRGQLGGGTPSCQFQPVDVTDRVLAGAPRD